MPKARLDRNGVWPLSDGGTITGSIYDFRGHDGDGNAVCRIRRPDGTKTEFVRIKEE